MARPAPAAVRATDIISFLAAHPSRAFTISELVRHLGMNIAFAHATLAVLCDCGFLIRDPVHRTDEDLEKLTSVVNELKAEAAAKEPFVPDPYTWSKLTYRFHELILEGCGNKTMAIQGAVLQDIVATHLRTKIAQRDDNDTAERFQRVIRSYEKLIAHVKAGNAAAAEKHWRSHMEGAAQYLLKDDLRTKPVVDLFA